MENLISTVSPNMLFKSPEDTKLYNGLGDAGMKELKLKYEELKTQGKDYGYSLPDINKNGSP